jgi:mannose-6-phosphate isomerase-like protein (cupin superfamily)
MTQPSNDPTPSPQYPLAQMTRIPLTGQIIGLNESQFVIAEWRDPGTPAGPPRLIAPLHVHYSDDEAWYVLEGTLAFRLGDQEIEAPAGSAVFAPRGVPHTFWNPDSTPARYLLIMTPNIRQMIEELHQQTSRDPLAIQTIYHRHNSALVS